jgi:ParB family chromosome partitioning protein
VDLLHDIGRLDRAGYSHGDIARKTGLSFEYVSGVSHLLEHGEQRLLRAVESRQMPLSVAVQIADVEDHAVQRTLQDAYDQGLLRGRRLIAAKRLLEVRRRRGKGLGHLRVVAAPKISASALIRAYQDDAARKRDLIRRARSASDRLLLIVEALSRLLRDAQFVALLNAESLATMPEAVASRVEARVKVAA